MRFKARIDGVHFSSKGCKLLGGFYGAAGETPRPTVILLHGVPGVEKNLDLAYALRDAGWNVLYFHYRGSWGSEGNYSLNGILDDVEAAMDWVLGQTSVDKERIALAGNSIGGYATLAAGAADLRFEALASLCPLIDPVDAPLREETANEFVSILHAVTARQLQEQWARLPSVLTMVEQLRNRKILMVTADQDEFFPPSHYEEIVRRLPELRWHRFPEADHSFCAYRRPLVEIVVRWLNEVNGTLGLDS